MPEGQASSGQGTIEAKRFSVGDLVFWNERNTQKRGTVVFLHGTWLSKQDETAVTTLRTGVRFVEQPKAVIVRVDRRHPVTDLELIPWYYAPSIEELGVL